MYFRGHKNITMRLVLTSALAFILGFLVGCEPLYDLHLDLQEGKMPPTFSFSGHSRAYEFEVLQLPITKPLSKTNPFDFAGETIWKIAPAKELKIRDWPEVEYGKVPTGFSQTIPSYGPAPTLAEGKLYAARITENKDSQTSVFFEIRHGKPVNVSDEVFGP